MINIFAYALEMKTGVTRTSIHSSDGLPLYYTTDFTRVRSGSEWSTTLAGTQA